MNKWTMRDDRATARCQGYDLEMWWGTGPEYQEELRKRNSDGQHGATLEQPEPDTAGMLIHLTSPHREVDTLKMLVMNNKHSPGENLRMFTGNTPPEDLLPQHDDLLEEWGWLEDHFGKVGWKLKEQSAIAFVGHLTITARRTTMGQVRRELKGRMEPEREYGVSHDIQQEIPEFPDNEPVFMADIQEDLNTIAARVIRAKDLGTKSIRGYIQKNDPARTVAEMIIMASQRANSGDRK